MSTELMISAAGGAALLVVAAIYRAVRRRRFRQAAAHELHRVLLLRLLDTVRYMPQVDARDILAAQVWLRSRRRWGERIPYDQGVRLRRLIGTISAEQRQRALLDVLRGPCVGMEDRAAGAFPVERGPVVEQVAAWLESNPLDKRIGAALLRAGCEVIVPAGARGVQTER